MNSIDSASPPPPKPVPSPLNPPNWWPPNDSPAWPIVRIGVLMISLGLFLYWNASHFDGGEVRTLLYTALASSGVEILGRKKP